MMLNLLSSLGDEIFLLRYGDLPLPRQMMFEPSSCCSVIFCFKPVHLSVLPSFIRFVCP